MAAVIRAWYDIAPARRAFAFHLRRALFFRLCSCEIGFTGKASWLDSANRIRIVLTTSRISLSGTLRKAPQPHHACLRSRVTVKPSRISGPSRIFPRGGPLFFLAVDHLARPQSEVFQNFFEELRQVVP